MIAIAEALERGTLDGAWATLLSGAWKLTLGRTVERRIDWPNGVCVVAVGGSTLGGSGKTPLAIACAAELAAHGVRTALVGHAYRASPGHARIVGADDDLGHVGDEALVAARSLAHLDVAVVVAPSRAEAVDLATRHADAIVLDGILQTAPRRVALALLSVDGAEPWGHAAAVPPRGDLRAPRRTLLHACDAIGPFLDDQDDAGTGARYARPSASRSTPYGPHARGPAEPGWNRGHS